MVSRIVHLADLHLDAPFARTGRGSQVSNARREGLREALKRALDFAREKQADALTIGGDLFEADYVTQDTAQFLRSQFEAAAPLRILIAPGNHDPYSRSSPYVQVEWPDNVFIFSEPHLKPTSLMGNVLVWGAAHDTADFRKPLVRDFRLPADTPAVLLLHGTDTSMPLPGNKGAFCPFTESEIRKAGFGLALLGHIHHGRLQPASDPLLCYPGSPEPLGFDEEVGHSILLAEWNGEGWRVETYDVSRWMCRITQVDVSGLESRDPIIEQLRQFASEERKGKRCLLQAELIGQLSSSIDLDLLTIQTALAKEYAEIQIENKTTPPFDLDALSKDQTITGGFVRALRQQAEEARRNGDEARLGLAERGLFYGLMALENREIRIR